MNALSSYAADDGILECWSFGLSERLRLSVLPDGCRDLILRFAPRGEWTFTVSSLDACAYDIDTEAGECFQGYRFHPAARFDAAHLLDAVNGLDYPDNDAVLPIIHDLVRVDTRLTEALEMLASATNVYIASRALNVSERTLERLTGLATGRSPIFWKNLARLRRGARMIAGGVEMPLAEIAADCGYADQAHMNREFRRWFGVTPMQFGSMPQLHNALLPGYG